MIGKLSSAWSALRIGLGLVALLAGLDKFFHILTDWGAYLGPWAERLLPSGADGFMHVAGAIEIAIGILILAGFARVGGYILAAWMLGIAIALAATGRYFDVAVGAIAMALAAFTLARLAKLRQDSEAFEEALEQAAVRGPLWRLWTERAPVTTERGLDLYRRTP